MNKITITIIACIVSISCYADQNINCKSDRFGYNSKVQEVCNYLQSISNTAQKQFKSSFTATKFDSNLTSLNNQSSDSKNETSANSDSSSQSNTNSSDSSNNNSQQTPTMPSLYPNSNDTPQNPNTGSGQKPKPASNSVKFY